MMWRNFNVRKKRLSCRRTLSQKLNFEVRQLSSSTWNLVTKRKWNLIIIWSFYEWKHEEISYIIIVWVLDKLDNDRKLKSKVWLSALKKSDNATTLAIREFWDELNKKLWKNWKLKSKGVIKNNFRNLNVSPLKKWETTANIIKNYKKRRFSRWRAMLLIINSCLRCHIAIIVRIILSRHLLWVFFV